MNTDVKSFLSYCDYIAHVIVESLSREMQYTHANTDDPIIEHVSRPKMDLHPTEGYLLTTDKIIEVTDVYGKSYRVTVEEIR